MYLSLPIKCVITTHYKQTGTVPHENVYMRYSPSPPTVILRPHQCSYAAMHHRRRPLALLLLI